VPEQYNRKPNSNCLICGKAIYRRPLERQSGRIFCSWACYGVSCRKESPCVICGNPILANLHKKTCSRACANKNRTGIHYGILRPYDKVKQTRTLKLRLLKEKGGRCERCGYSKVEVLQIHHKDRNKNNNSMDNLEIICPNCHYEEHYLENSWMKNEASRS